MTDNKLEQAKRQASIEIGSQKFFARNPFLWPSDANQSVLAGLIEQKSLGGFDDPDSWQKAFELGKHLLCERPAPKLEPPSGPAEWPSHLRFMRPIYTYADILAYPPNEYKSLYFDKARGGAPSEKQKLFRAVVQEIIDRENSKGGQR